MDGRTTIQRLTECLNDIKGVHSRTFELLLECRDPPGKSKNEDLVDLAFLMRKAMVLAEDLRKELRGAKEQLEKIICIRWLASTETMDVAKIDMSIRGKLAVGTPRVKTTASLPLAERNPKEYAAFMRRIGVFGQAIRWGLVRPHWPSVTEYFSDLMAKGRPLPPGIDPSRTYSVYQVVMRERKGADDE